MKFKLINGKQNHHIVKPIRDDGSVSDTYWVRASKTGKPRLEESLRTTSLTEAQIERDKKLGEYLGLKPALKLKAFLVEDKFPEFLALKKGKAKSTQDSMRNQWENHLKAHFGGLLLDQVTESEWLTYVNNKRGSTPDRKFFNDRKYLSMFLHWLHRGGLISKVPKLENVDPEIDPGKVYSDDEIKSLIDCAKPDLQLQIKMAITMGMRVGEILSMEWTQIDWRKKTIYLPAHKTKIRKARTFRVSVACFEALRERKDVNGGQFIFPSPEDPDKSVGKGGNKTAWANCKERANVEGKFHWLRHTFLTHAFKKTVNPALICEYAGLSLEEAQKTYLHFTPDDTAIVAELVSL